MYIVVDIRKKKLGEYFYIAIFNSHFHGFVISYGKNDFEFLVKLPNYFSPLKKFGYDKKKQKHVFKKITTEKVVWKMFIKVRLFTCSILFYFLNLKLKNGIITNRILKKCAIIKSQTLFSSKFVLRWESVI